MRSAYPLPTLLILVVIGMSSAMAGNMPADQRDFWSVNGGFAYAWDENAFQDFEADDAAAYLSAGWGIGPYFMPDWMGVEAELGLTVTDGRWLEERWSMYSGAAYLTVHLGSPSLYIKARGGVSSSRVEMAGFAASDTGLAGGMGIGFRLLDQPLELHFTAVDGNVNTLTLHWRF